MICMYWRSRLPASSRIQRSLHGVVDFLLCAGSFSEKVGLQGRPFHGMVLFRDTHKHPFVRKQLFLRSVGFVTCLKLRSVGMANDSKKNRVNWTAVLPDTMVKIFLTEQGHPSEGKPTSLWAALFLPVFPSICELKHGLGLVFCLRLCNGSC